MPQESALGTPHFVRNDLNTNTTETKAFPKQQGHKGQSIRNLGEFKKPAGDAPAS